MFITPERRVKKQGQTVLKTATREKPTMKQISKQKHRPIDAQKTDRKNKNNLQTDINLKTTFNAATIKQKDVRKYLINIFCFKTFAF